MTTLNSNEIKVMIFGTLIIIGVFVSVLSGNSSSEALSIAGKIITLLGGAGLLTTDKIYLGGNVEGNEKEE